MKPKEKAEQLIKQFKHRNQYSSDNLDAIGCALICVNEIIEEVKTCERIITKYEPSAALIMWLEVKKELEKL